MAKKHNYRYLNRGDASLFISRLGQELAKAQNKAPVSQWVAFIKGLTTKGVKGAEIEESKILQHLEMFPPNHSLTREELGQWLLSNTATVKEMDLLKPRYGGYHFKLEAGDTYQESLYVLNSERDNIDDRLAEIRFELEELDFNMELLAEDPLIAVRLYEEQKSLNAGRATASGPTFGHWSDVIDESTKQQVSSMIAHARTTTRGDLYFIEEIQSDWAQKGRKRAAIALQRKLRSIIGGRMLSADSMDKIVGELRKTKGKPSDEFKAMFEAESQVATILSDQTVIERMYEAICAPADWQDLPVGPWVSSTELWSNLMLRRQFQRAAENANIKRVAWIKGDMRNGGGFAAQDGLDSFYLKILPKLADKILSGTGEKIRFTKVQLNGQEYDVPGFNMTDKVREKMLQAQPLYSRDLLPSTVHELSDNEYAAFSRELHKAHEMLGNGVSVRLAKRVLDVANGEEVAARQIGRLIEVSLSARNPARALAHESWHFAYEHLLSEEDRAVVDRAFADGSKLNIAVREALVREKASPEALVQCDDTKEAAANCFLLWVEGKISMSAEEAFDREETGNDGFDRTIGKVFRKVERAFISLGNWTRRVLGETPNQKVERQASEVFAKLRAGMMREADIVPVDEYPEVEPVSASPRARMRA